LGGFRPSSRREHAWRRHQAPNLRLEQERHFDGLLSLPLDELTNGSVSCSLPFVATYGAPVLEALADPTRRSIFELLGAGPRSVGDITKDVAISRPAVSQHLKVLKDAGLVTARPEGTRRIYQLDPVGLQAARDYFSQFWTAALTAYAKHAENEESP
jgi:DNA-binding transcriptional ArsR family regulator